MSRSSHIEEAVIRIGVTGKTGSGKTTVSALVALVGAARGLRTLAVDTDVSPNLALSLGLDQVSIDAARAVPRALVAGRGGGSITTTQLIDGFGMTTPSGVTLLHAMPTSDETGGCWCPAHASARGLLAQALDDEADLAVLDLEAGLDHLERADGTVAHTDVLLVVVEPSRKSSTTAERMIGQARAHGIGRIALVGNKGSAGGGDDADFAVTAALLGVPLAGVVPRSDAVIDADRAGSGLDVDDPPVRAGIDTVLASIL